MEKTEKVVKYWRDNGYMEKSMTNSMPKWVVVLATLLVFIPCDIIIQINNVFTKWVKYLNNY